MELTFLSACPLAPVHLEGRPCQVQMDSRADPPVDLWVWGPETSLGGHLWTHAIRCLSLSQVHILAISNVLLKTRVSY